MNANDSISSNILFNEFVVGVSDDEDEDIPKNVSKQKILSNLYDQLKSSYKMIDTNPFILYSSQNCTEMIVAVGNKWNFHLIG
jgi:hypothetical protein